MKAIMLRFYHLIVFFLIFFIASSTTYAAFPIVPEFQIYHTLGTRGSSFTTAAAGLGIYLSKDDRGADRYLQLLALYAPEEVADAQMKVGGWFTDKAGQGFEIGIQDEWKESSELRGANISLRYLAWEEAHLGSQKSGKISANTIHLGWSAGTAVLSFFIGLDFASLHTPQDYFLETQMLLGTRTSF